jgi:hypothetical protein
MTPSSAPCAYCWEMSVVAREAPSMLLRERRRARVGVRLRPPDDPGSAPCAYCWEMSVVAREAPAMLLRVRQRACVGSPCSPR